MSHALASLAAKAVSAKELIALTQALVQIPSVYVPETAQTEEAVVDYLFKHLSAMGLSPVKDEVAPGRSNIICDWQGKHFDPIVHKTLLFEGHTDVVTPGQTNKWQYPPFSGKRIHNRIYGRGSADMKAGIAASIAALKAIMKVQPDLPGRIRLGFVVDEEDMMLGIKHFIKQGWANDVDGAIICEPEANEICLYQKGAMRVAVYFNGLMAHGAMPYAGVNPIPALMSFLQKLKAYEQSEQARLGPHPSLGHTFFTPTIIKAPLQGEAQVNVIPDEAYLVLDIRSLPGQNHEEIMLRLQSFADTLSAATPELNIRLDCFESRPWTQTPKDDPLVKAIEASYPLIFDYAAKYGGVPGATDGTFLRAWADVPIVTIGPGNKDIPHQANEYVDCDELVASARLYAASAIHYLKEV